MKFFISSTYEDLQEYRQVIFQCLNGLNHRISGMEFFGSDHSQSLEVCLDEVSKSDIYVAIVGYRYGSIHGDYQKSYTESEYDYALDLKKECLIFLVSDNAKNLFITNHSEYLLNKDRMESFRIKLKNGHTVSFFENKDELTHKFLSTLYRKYPHISPQQEAFPQLDDLIRVIDSHSAPDLAYQMQDNLTELDCINTLSKMISDLDSGFEHIRENLGQLPDDLKTFWSELGHDVSEIDQVPYYHNPFFNRLWEPTHLGFYNWIFEFRIIHKFLEYFYYQRLYAQDPLSVENKEQLDITHNSLKKLLARPYAD